MQATLLARAGYDAWNWSDKALLRAVIWQYTSNHFPATGHDTWQIPIINCADGTHFPGSRANAGKNMGWTDWMFAG